MLLNNKSTSSITSAMDTNLIFQRLHALPADQQTLAVGFILGLSVQQAQENDRKDTKQQGGRRYADQDRSGIHR